MAVVMHILEAIDLYRFYHIGDSETLALRGVSLHVDAGEIVVVMGPSGSGKSTLLACLAGLDEPDGGRVELLGRRLSRRPEAERAMRRATTIGIQLQAGNLFAHLSVAQNIRLAMRLACKPDERWLAELMDLMGVAHRQHMLPSQLSGGEAARAGLAVALAAAPPLLLADEPTGEVDAATEAQIIRLFLTHRDNNGAALIVTHSPALAAHADRVLHLCDGRISDG